MKTDTNTDSILQEIILSEFRYMRKRNDETNLHLQKIQAQNAMTQIELDKTNITVEKTQVIVNELKDAIYGSDEKNETGIKKIVDMLNDDFTKRKIIEIINNKKKKIFIAIITSCCTIIAWLITTFKK